jgi:hypothetical protein
MSIIKKVKGNINERFITNKKIVEIFGECREPFNELMLVNRDDCMQVIKVFLIDKEITVDLEKKSRLIYDRSCFEFLNTEVGKRLSKYPEDITIKPRLICHCLAEANNEKYYKAIHTMPEIMDIFWQDPKERKFTDAEILQKFQACCKPMELFQKRHLKGCRNTIIAKLQELGFDDEYSSKLVKKVFYDSCCTFHRQVITNKFNFLDDKSLSNWLKGLCRNECDNTELEEKKGGVPSQTYKKAVKNAREKDLEKKSKKYKFDLYSQGSNKNKVPDEAELQVSDSNIFDKDDQLIGYVELINAILSLNYRCKILLLLFHFQNFEDQTIAEFLNTNTDVVKSTRLQCREKLAKILGNRK